MTLTLGYSHPRLRIEADAIALIRRHGVRHLEMRIDDIERDGPLHSRAFRNVLRCLREDEGLSLSMHAFSGINLAEKVGRLRTVCLDLHLEQMAFCEAVGASWLNIHIGACGFDQASPRKADRLALAGESLIRLLDATAGSAVGLGIENVERLPTGLRKTYLGDRLSEMLTILEGQGSRVGAVFDIGHANIHPEQTPSDFLAGVKHRLWAVHVHRNGGDRDVHAALDHAWVEQRHRLFRELSAMSVLGVPLIAEHDKLEKADATLTILKSMEPPS